MGYRNRGRGGGGFGGGYRSRGSGGGGGGFGGGYGGGFKPAPVEVGKEYEADITEMSHRGDAGVARIQGFIIFVTGAKVGQKIKFVITKIGRRYATAEIVKGEGTAAAEESEEETEEAKEEETEETEEETEETEEESDEEEETEETEE